MQKLENHVQIYICRSIKALLSLSWKIKYFHAKFVTFSKTHGVFEALLLSTIILYPLFTQHNEVICNQQAFNRWNYMVSKCDYHEFFLYNKQTLNSHATVCWMTTLKLAKCKNLYTD
jgi:hypothetical protein